MPSRERVDGPSSPDAAARTAGHVPAATPITPAITVVTTGIFPRISRVLRPVPVRSCVSLRLTREGPRGFAPPYEMRRDILTLLGPNGAYLTNLRRVIGTTCRTEAGAHSLGSGHEGHW
ncbi:hypothetical protein GCM10023085_68330 [Actinomadura viridis]